MQPSLIYGRSGAGKTSWWVLLARYLHETKGLRTRCYLGDGGGATIDMNNASSFIDVYHYPLHVNPFETVLAITEGKWPLNPDSPTSPFREWTHEDSSTVGLVVFEGLTVMGDYLMGSQIGGLASRMAKGEILNNDASFKLTDGTAKIGGNARSHYMLAQRHMWEAVGRTEMLPVPVLWTAHERKAGEDEASKDVIIGPDVVGQALTSKIGACFGYTVHLHPVHVTEKVKDQTTGLAVERTRLDYRAYTQDHYDPNLKHYVRYYANVRVHRKIRSAHPDLMPEHIPANSLDFYERLTKARLLGDALDKAEIAGLATQITL